MVTKELTESKTLSLVTFSSKKEELALRVEKAKDLTIAGVDDKEGYDLVHSARMGFVKTRGEIGKDGKALKAEALKFRKDVIEIERELVNMIAPIEDELSQKERIVNEEKEKIKNVEALPGRIEKLKEIDVVISDDLLLSMDDKKFNSLLVAKKEEYLAEKERKIFEAQENIKEETRKIEETKRLEEARKQAEIEAKEAAIQDAKLAKLKAEEDKRKAVEEEKRKAEAEKRRLEEEKKQAVEAEKLKAKQEKEKLIADQKEKERQRLEKERIAKEKIEEEKRKAKEEAEKLAKKKKYIDFLKEHGYTEESKHEFHIIQIDNLTKLYKKVGEINI